MKFQKKPVVVEAWRWPDHEVVLRNVVCTVQMSGHPTDPHIHTTRGPIAVRDGDWIIRDADGLRPCKPDVFADTYERVE